MEELKYDHIRIDGATIMTSLFNQYKNESWVLSSSDIEEKRKSWFPGKWGEEDFNLYKHKFGLKSGITLDEVNSIHFLIDSENSFNCGRLDSLKKIGEIFEIHDSLSIKIKYSSYKGKFMMSEPEIQFLQEFINNFSSEVDKQIEYTKNQEKNHKEKEKIRLESLKKRQTKLLQEFDKDGNGVIDVIEGSDDFMILFKKHQKKVIEVDKQYIQNFVKVSNYLKVKRQNIQDVFLSISNIHNQLQLEENVGILKNQIHTYKLLLFHSLNMIISIVEDDLITFYEIYESFDKLNIFNSNWENEVSLQLKNIEDGLSNLMYSINSMEGNIVNGLNKLSYVTQEGFSELQHSVTSELQSIDSSVKFNNLLTAISAYQLYKINKQTNSLNK